MAKLRIRLKINPGRIGTPLKKFSLVSQDLHGFLRAAVYDLKLQEKDADWIAKDFANGSAEFTAENLGSFGVQEAQEFHSAVHKIVSFDPARERLDGPFKKSTLQQYTRIGAHLDADEYIEVGFYGELEKVQDWQRLSKRQSVEISESLLETIEYVGAVFGKIHALYKEASPPYFNLRDLDTGGLVNCYYKVSHYGEVIEVLRDKDAFVHVGGLVRANMIKHEIESIMVDKLRLSTSFSEDEYRALLGSLPNITGDLSTKEFISRIRGDDE